MPTTWNRVPFVLASRPKLADRIVGAPIPCGRRLIEHDHHGVFADVGIRQESSPHQRDPHRREVARTRDDEARAFGVAWWMALALDRRRPATSIERKLIAESRHHYAWRGAHRIGELSQIRTWRTHRLVGEHRRRYVHGKREQMIGIESRRCCAERTQSQCQRAAGDEQRERGRNLGDDECLRHTSGARANGYADAGFERVSRRGLSRLPQRRQRGRHRGEQSERQRHQGDSGVHLDDRRARHELGAKERHRADQRHAHEDAERGAGDRHERALEKELPPEPGRRGAKRDARGYFSRTRHRSHEQEAGDVRARDDEEQ